MMRAVRPERGVRTTRYIQIAMLVLMGICFAQVGWWVLDQINYAGEIHQQVSKHLESDVNAAQIMMRAGADVSLVARAFPHLRVESRPSQIAVAKDTLARFERARFHRLNRYVWEGLFFFAVLAVGMVVLFRALSRDAALRRRQQNFLAAVSHEFKSPLASLKLSTETLALRDPQAQARERIVARMTEDIDRLDGMVTNLLDTARLEEGQAALRPEVLAVADVIAGVVGVAAHQAGAAAVAFEVEAPDGLTMTADPNGLATILRNLVDNAVKAVQGVDAGVVRILASREGDDVRIKVTDNGVGFPPEERVNIFRKFYRPGDEMRRKSRGSGLGLYLVRRLVELHGGQVSAASGGPRQGAVFTVSLPIKGKGGATR